MKSGYLLALLSLVPSLALADIYKVVDADGHVTYSSSPIKGGKKIVTTPSNPTSPGRSNQAAPSRPSASPQDFPKVNQETQKGRDESRRKILADELKTEEGLLAEASQNLKAGEAIQPKNNEKLKELTGQVDLHQRNINALKIELSKLK